MQQHDLAPLLLIPSTGCSAGFFFLRRKASVSALLDSSDAIQIAHPCTHTFQR